MEFWSLKYGNDSTIAIIIAQCSKNYAVDGKREKKKWERELRFFIKEPSTQLSGLW